MTKEQIVQDIILLLGGSVIDLELKQEEILRFVHMAFGYLSPYVGNTRMITKTCAPVIDLSADGVTEVLRVLRSDPIMARDGQELLFDFQKFRRVRGIQELTEKQLVNRYSIDDIYIPFEFIDGKLYISQGVAIGNLTIEAIGDNTIDDLKPNSRGYNWVFRMATALTKEAIGHIRGKFTSSSLPVTLDGERMIQEAQNEKQALMDELKTNNWGPVFVLR